MLGLFTRPVAFVLSGEMAVVLAISGAKRHMANPESRQPAVLLCFIFLFFAAHGAGEWSAGAILRRGRTMEKAA